MNFADQPIAMSPQIHTYTEFWRQIHDDLWIQQVYRCYSSRPRTGNWKVKTYGICLTASFILLVLSVHHLHRRMGSRSYAR